MKLTITTGTEKEFFERGKIVAQKLDRGERIDVEERSFHGHGRMKVVTVAAETFQLTATVG